MESNVTFFSFYNFELLWHHWITNQAVIDVQLNHVLKTRDLVTKNNEKLQRQQTASNENGKKGADFIDPPRDQGFTRPKVMNTFYQSLVMENLKRIYCGEQSELLL